MKTIDDLDVAGKRVLVRADLNVPLDGTRITDDGRIRASVPTINALLERGRQGDRDARTWAARRASPDPEVLASPRSPSGSASCSARPVTFAADTVGESAQAAVAALPDGEVALLENVRFNAGGDQPRTTPSAARSPTSSRRWPTCSSPTASARCTASTPRSTTSPTRLPHAAGCLIHAEVEVLQASSPRTSRGPTRSSSAARRSPTSSRSSTTCSTKADRILVGGGMVLHLPQGPGPRGRQVAAGRGPDRHRAAATCARAETRRGVRAADRHRRRRPRSPPTPTHEVVAADAIPADRLGLDIGPESGKLFAPSWPTPRPSSGTARWACSRWSRTPAAPAPWRRA